MQCLIASHRIKISLLATVTNTSYIFMIHIDCAFLEPAWLQHLAFDKKCHNSKSTICSRERLDSNVVTRYWLDAPTRARQ